MRKQSVANALKGLVLMPALWLACPALAAEAPKSRSQQSPATAASKQPEWDDLELDEVLVDGQKPSKDPDVVKRWFTRLVGAFRFEGHVEVPSDTETTQRVPVRGTAACYGIGGELMDRHEAPGVECILNVTWPQVRRADGAEPPGSSSTLRPAVLLFAYEADVIGVHHMLVDNKGVAEGGTGLLFGNAVVTTTPCARIEGNCRRRVRVTADPDLKSVQIKIALQVDGKAADSYDFVLQRETAPP